MSLDPILPPLLLVGAAAVLGGFAAWRALASRSALRLAWFLRAAMMLLLLLVALRPTIPGSGTGPVATGGLEVYFAVDTTSSMAAEDVPDRVPGVDADGGRPATRLDAVKADIATISAGLPGAQFSLTTFDGSTVQRVPLTSDATALQNAAEAITQEITYYSSGSSIDEPLEFLLDLLSSAQQEHPDRRRVLFYLGDGEQTRAQQPVSFVELSPYVGGGAVLGYGTDEGGIMRIFSGFDEDLGGGEEDGLDGGEPDAGYIQDPEVARDAVSRIDRSNLEAVADQLQVPFLERADGAPLDEVLAGIDVGDVEVRPGSFGGPLEFYWILAIPLGLLAVRELIALVFALLAARSDLKAIR